MLLGKVEVKTKNWVEYKMCLGQPMRFGTCCVKIMHSHSFNIYVKLSSGEGVG